MPRDPPPPSALPPGARPPRTAAFIASRNKPTLDRDLFEHRAKPTRRRAGGRGATGRAGEAGQEADRQVGGATRTPSEEMTSWLKLSRSCC
jgi:hypothetical protein